MNRFFAFVGALVCAIVVYSLILAFNTSYFIAIIVPFAFIIPIWFIGDKKTKGKDLDRFFDRLGHIKDYQIRSRFSILLYIVFVSASVGAVSGNADMKSKEIYNNTPTPEIKLISNSGYVGSNTGYTLIFSVSGSDTVTVNGYASKISGENYKEFFDLKTPKLDINISAINGQKTTKLSTSIVRDKTTLEIEADKKIEQEKIEQEKKDAIERANQEKKEKAIEAKEKRIEAQYTKIAKYGYQYEVSTKLFNRGFKEFSSEFATAPDGSSQVETVYVNNIEGCYVEVTLQGSYSIDSHYYKVSADCK